MCLMKEQITQKSFFMNNVKVGVEKSLQFLFCLQSKQVYLNSVLKSVKLLLV